MCDCNPIRAARRTQSTQNQSSDLIAVPAALHPRHARDSTAHAYRAASRACAWCSRSPRARAGGGGGSGSATMVQRDNDAADWQALSAQLSSREEQRESIARHSRGEWAAGWSGEGGTGARATCNPTRPAPAALQTLPASANKSSSPSTRATHRQPTQHIASAISMLTAVAPLAADPALHGVSKSGAPQRQRLHHEEGGDCVITEALQRGAGAATPRLGGPWWSAAAPALGSRSERARCFCLLLSSCKSTHRFLGHLFALPVQCS